MTTGVSPVILPGSTIGMVGGGQLAKMMTLEAKRMGYRVGILDPDRYGPAGQVADFTVEGALSDPKAALEFAERVDVITMDTEHVPAQLLEELEKLRPVRPRGGIFRIIQDRGEQRDFLRSQGAPQPNNAVVRDARSLEAAAASIGFPSVLKTCHAGYDGKGQVKVENEAQLRAGFELLERAPCVLEAFIPFQKEVSVLLARGVSGEVVFYPIAENVHKNHVLHTTRVPAQIPSALASAAQDLGKALADALDHVGMMAIELFVTEASELLVNEIAPRTHNSGHFTFGAAATSQFEQHVLAVCGLPLGSTKLHRPCVMLNLFGDLWTGGEPNWEAVFRLPDARLHLYGKAKPSPGRKMGHVLFQADSVETALAMAAGLEAQLPA